MLTNNFKRVFSLSHKKNKQKQYKEQTYINGPHIGDRAAQTPSDHCADNER